MSLVAPLGLRREARKRANESRTEAPSAPVITLEGTAYSGPGAGGRGPDTSTGDATKPLS